MTLPRLLSLSTAAALLAAPTAAQACSVCLGAPEDVGNAMNGAIFMMLACIGSMLAFISGVAIYIARRKPTVEDPLSTPPLS